MKYEWNINGFSMPLCEKNPTIENLPCTVKVIPGEVPERSSGRSPRDVLHLSGPPLPTWEKDGKYMSYIYIYIHTYCIYLRYVSI